MQITGIILAGGKSRRMKSDKALIEIERKTLLRRAVEFCRLFCDEILISSNNSQHTIEGTQRITDEVTNCGPIGGIYSCLKQSKNNWNFVFSVDSPFVQSSFVHSLLEETNDFDAVVPIHKKGKEPLIALYNKNVLPHLKFHLDSGNYKMHFLLEKVKVNFVNSDDWIEKYPRLFHNINYPEDLKTEN